MDNATQLTSGRDGWTFERLIAPLSSAGFRDVLAQRKVVRLPNLGSTRFSTLFGWERLCDLVAAERGDIPSLQVTRDGTPIPRMFYQTKGRVDATKVFRLVDAGHSVMIRNLSAHAPEIRDLSEDLRTRLNENIRVAVVTTKGEGGAFPLHFDAVDVLAVQLEGCKRWCIYDQPTIDPVWGMHREAGQAEGNIVHDVPLEAGDVLFVPAGHSHRCFNVAERSTHLAFLFLPPSAQAILQVLADDVASDPQLRRPVGRASHEVIAEPAEQMKAALLEHIRRIPAEELVRRFVQSALAPDEY